LLDDHKMVRRGLELLLEQEHIDVVGSFNTSGEMFTALHGQTADVLIVGYSFRSTEADDLKMIRSFKIRFPNEKVLVVSTHYNTTFMALTMKAGARGFICKEQSGSDLITAIQTVAAGHIYLGKRKSQEMAPSSDEIFDYTDELALINDTRLSPMEKQVLRRYLDSISMT